MLKNSAESVSLTIMRWTGVLLSAISTKRLGSIGRERKGFVRLSRFYDMSRNVTRPEGSLQAFLCLEAG